MVRLPLKGILFDLDHTLWDFAKNSREAMRDVFTEEKISESHGIDFDTFHSTYIRVNDYMWGQYRQQHITKEQLRVGRFEEALRQVNVNNNMLAEKISTRYLQLSPYKTHLFPGTHEVLAYLKTKYTLALVTNGFNEVQYVKIKESGIHPYFHAVVTSEEAGVQKPHKDIFHRACSKIMLPPEDCIMIGDNWEADMEGAKNAGLQRIHFDPDKTARHTVENRIYDLRELQTLL
ncbi:MAG: YjjG family noncanonical pyrimidine nucleotidase [Flavobacteriales bacterium]